MIQEGLKLYRGFDMKLRLFRPDLNCARLRLSSLRGGLPDFDPDELLKLIEAFVRVDGDRWLPEPGTFLYLRPAIIGTSAALGVSRPAEATLFLVAVLFPQFGQAGPGLKLLCSSGQVRAWPGGFGNAKVRIIVAWVSMCECV
jgi:branched-chain amino acid aminotransferase